MRASTSRVLTVILATGALPSALRGQPSHRALADLPPTAYVRLHTVDQLGLEGRLLRVDSASITLGTPLGARTIPRTSIREAEQRRGTRLFRGMLFGTAIG